MNSIIISGLAIAAIIGVVYLIKNKKDQENTEPEMPIDTNTAPKVIVSQDHWDSDNYSMIDIAGRLHKNGVINLIAVDISGRDTYGMSGILFRSMLPDDVPIFMNHHGDTRVTPTGGNFPLINNYTQDTTIDAKRPGIDEMAELISKTTGNITYISGGHLDNLARLVEKHNSVVASKFSKVVMSIGWNSTTNGKPEMNFSQGVPTPTPTSVSTQMVFNNMPENVKMIIGMDPARDTLTASISTSFIKTPSTKYLTENGTYHKGGIFRTGDLTSLIYGIYGGDWFGTHIFNEIPCCLNINIYGACTVSSGTCNHSYITTVASDGFILEIFKDLLKA